MERIKELAGKVKELAEKMKELTENSPVLMGSTRELPGDLLVFSGGFKELMFFLQQLRANAPTEGLLGLFNKLP